MDTKDQTVDSILRSIRAEVDEFVSREQSITCPIEYEKQVLSIAMNFGRNLIQGSQGKLPSSRNLKKK